MHGLRVAPPHDGGSVLLGLGTSSMGGRQSMRRSKDLLFRAVDLGYAYFDTAPTYGFGDAERLLSAVPSTVHVTTKFGLQVARSWRTRRSVRATVRTVASAPGVAQRLRQSSGAQVQPLPLGLVDAVESVVGSSRRLGRPCLDLLLLHEPLLPDLQNGEAGRVLGRLSAAGLSKRVGASLTDHRHLTHLQLDVPVTLMLPLQEVLAARRAGLLGPEDSVVVYGVLRDPDGHVRAQEVPARMREARVAAGPSGVVLTSTGSRAHVWDNMAAWRRSAD